MEFTILNKQLGKVVIKISQEDADLTELRWSLAGGKGSVGAYAVRRGEYLHNVVARRMGLVPDQGHRWKATVDHINGDKLDNRRENLRLRTRQQQMLNPNDGVQRNNSSGHRGVSYHKATDSWYASVMVDGRTKSLGRWATLEEAVLARQAWDARGEVLAQSKQVRSDNTSGYRGVSLTKSRAGAKPWLAYATKQGKRITLGYFATKDEAIAARQSWNEANSM